MKIESCIIKHFEHYSPLTEDDKRLLSSLEKNPREYPKNSAVWTEGEPANHFYTVSKGWVYSYRNMDDGSRQVLDIYVPGDVVGLRELVFDKRITGLTTCTDAVLCAFPKTRLTEVFSESLLLCSLFFMVSANTQAILLERLINMGRRSARQKVAHLLLEISRRLERTASGGCHGPDIPLTQTLIADALGLSSVHVNRVFKELREEGLIDHSHGQVEVVNIDTLREVVGSDGSALQESIQPILQHARQLQKTINGAGKATSVDDAPTVARP